MQISIVVVADVVATLKEKSIDKNVYQIDNTSGFDGEREHSENPISVTRVAGVCNPDGSQAEEAVLNWIVMSIAALPTTTLPRGYDPTQKSDVAFLNAIKKAGPTNRIKELLDRSGPPSRVLPPFLLEQENNSVLELDTPLLDVMGQPVMKMDIDAAAYVPLRVKAIYGPAVEEGVMFPALYGSPDMKSPGWYWSATVDIAKTGLHVYYMDTVLHRPKTRNGRTVWVPETFTVTGYIDVCCLLAVNGFTGCVDVWPRPLPLLPTIPVLTGDVI